MPPVLLERLGEPVGSVLNNLDRAACLGLLAQTSKNWIAVQALRSRTVYEYIRKPGLLAEVVNQAHQAVPMLVDFVAPCASFAAARRLV